MRRVKVDNDEGNMSLVPVSPKFWFCPTVAPKEKYPGKVYCDEVLKSIMMNKILSVDPLSPKFWSDNGA